MKKIIFSAIIFIFVINIYAGLSKTNFLLSSNINNDTGIENINISIPVNSLIFLKRDTCFVSNIGLHISFLDKKETPLFSDYIDTSFILKDYISTQNDSNIILNFNYPIENKYAFINIYMEDKNSDNNITFKAKILPIKIIKGDSYISSIEQYPNNNMHFFNPDSMNFIIDYQLKDSTDNVFIVKILHRDKILKSWKLKLNNSGKDTILLSYNKLTTGKYQLNISLLKDKKILSTINTNFFIDFSFVYSTKEYMDIVNALAYFGKKSNIDNLKKAKPTDRKEEWEKFWKENKISITFDEFIKRYHYVNNNFSIYNKLGYQTDFGRIFLIYGKPDEIERHPFDLDAKPYEVWYYYSLNYKFIFVDENNYGDYKLQNYYDNMR